MVAGSDGGRVDGAMVELVIRRPGQPDRVVHLKRGTHMVGRGADTDVILDDTGVSRRHAQIVVDEDGVLIEDLNSANGTYVAGQAITRRRVTSDDEVVVEPFTLRFSAGAAEEKQNLVARLEIIEGLSSGEIYGVGEEGASIGRAENQTVQIKDAGASRWHANVLWRNGECVVEDHNSSNGVYVNGQRIKSHVLRHGDVIRISKTKIRFATEEVVSAVGGSGGVADISPAVESGSDAGVPVRAPKKSKKKGGMMWVIISVLLVFIIAFIGMVALVGVWWAWSNGMIGMLEAPPEALAWLALR